MLSRLRKLLSGSSPSVLNKPALPGDADATPLLAPRNPVCFIDLGNTLRDQGRFEEAIAAYRSGIAIEPSADSCFRLASTLWETEQANAARQAYRQAIELRPDFADAYNNLACIEKAQGHLDECVRNAELALSCDPGHYIAHDTLGHALQFLGRIEEATDHYRLAISRRADYAQGYSDLGNALGELGRFDEAMAAFDRALEIQPDYPDVQWNRGLFWLVRGDFKRGWEGYERRFHTHVAKKEYLRDFKQPVWMGEDLHGKTILLHAEQGFGDTLQFVRFVPLIAAQGARIYLEVPSGLERLVRNLPGLTAVFTLGAVLPSFDVYCSLMSLPHRLGTRLETIPCDIPYLGVPDALTELWKKRLAVLPGLKVGLVWSGNPGNPMDGQRSISLDHVRMLLDLPGISFVSLQKRAANSSVTIQESRLHDWMDECVDFLDTAALILALDLVIAIDTSVAHLAGALGKPVWMLNRFNTDWRWLQARNDSPWYPTMRLFRQAQIGDWTTPIARLRTALDEAARTFAETGRFINPPPAPAQAVQMPDATVEAAAEAAKNEGNAAYSNGNLEQAEQHYRRAVTLNPGYAEAHNNLALVLRAQQKYLAAEKHLLRAIAAKPELSNAYFNLGCLFVDTGRTTDAAVQFKKTLALDPDNANTHVELANLVGKQGQLDEAEQHLRKALTLDPQSPQAYCNLASVFLSRGDTERAIDHARKSVEIDPAFAGGQNVLGAILLESGRLDLAAAALRQAIALAPDLKIAQYNLALCLMLMGNYDEGFALYESRDTTPRLAGVSENEHGKLMEIVSSISPWRGESLEGRRLLVWQEQGFGDLLMMLRYLPLLLEKGVTEITLRCTPIQALARLVAAMPGGDRVQVIDLLAAVSPEVDFQCPQMSLPYLFGTRPETIPRNIPYLVAPDEIAKPWKVRLNNLPGLKVGLVWSGNSNNRSDAQRSITPALLVPLLAVAGVSFVSLQKLAKDSPMAIHDGALHDWMNECTDFLDTAALIENLDLVIAVDTAVAHLAGALGKPVWLLNRLNTDWRWFQDREDSPWYPTMRIFRQTRRGEWGEPIERIGVALDAVARTFDSTGSFINPSLLPST